MIAITNNYKYLGLLFTSNGSFLSARKQLAEQAKRAMHSVLAQSRALNLPLDLQLKLFDHTVVPILLYGAEVWGHESHEVQEKVQVEFSRKITNAKKSTPRYMLYGELGRYPLTINIKTRMVNFWNKIICSHRNKISKQVYNYVLNDTSNEYKWLTYIKNILFNTGNGIIWITHNHKQVKNIHTLIRHNLIDQLRQEWSQQLTQSQKARNYSIFKLDLRFEPYLSILPSSLAISLFLFRTANQKLPVEFGRWNGTPCTERKCTKCMSNAICDEMHCLFSCPYFKALYTRELQQ